MRTRFRILITLTAAVMTALSTAAIRITGQAPGGNGPQKPNLSGIWQAVNTASWDIQTHSDQPGIPAGQGVVVGNDLPYQPWAAAKKRENLDNRATSDPETLCYLPGVPRATYMPFPFEIVQTPTAVVIRYEYAHGLRIISTDGRKHPEGSLSFWMGDSRGHWEG